MSYKSLIYRELSTDSMIAGYAYYSVHNNNRKKVNRILLKFYNVYKRIKEVGELTLGDLTVTPSPHPQVAKSLYLFSSSNTPPHCGEERCVTTLTTAV